MWYLGKALGRRTSPIPDHIVLSKPNCKTATEYQIQPAAVTIGNQNF